MQKIPDDIALDLHTLFRKLDDCVTRAYIFGSSIWSFQNASDIDLIFTIAGSDVDELKRKLGGAALTRRIVCSPELSRYSGGIPIPLPPPLPIGKPGTLPAPKPPPSPTAKEFHVTLVSDDEFDGSTLDRWHTYRRIEIIREGEFSLAV